MISDPLGRDLWERATANYGQAVEYLLDLPPGQQPDSNDARRQEIVAQLSAPINDDHPAAEQRVSLRGQTLVRVMEGAGEAGQVVTANLDASNERAERIIAATAKLEARQLWSAAAAMCLALLPVAVVVAGLWMGIAGLITGAQWALDVTGSVWLGIGRWLVFTVDLAGAGYGLFASACWITGLVETWRDRGMPNWPRRKE